MVNRLVVVESPAKAKTIKKYLGKGYQVLASYGHVRDLLPKEGAVDPASDFAMKYVVIEKNANQVKTIAESLKKVDELLLATDPDREGEAIAYHLCELMREKGLLKEKPVHRVVFHEITKTAILEAINHARDLSMDLVNAQQARRALDYLVGFNLSPLLWRKVRPGLSAGRVQSPALRMIVERELEIEKFQAREYWTIEADVTKDEQPFTAKLVEFSEEKLKQFSVTDGDMANQIIADLKKAGKGKLIVKNIEKKKRKRNPSAPFTTSTLQQEASRKLGFGAARTMRIAQQLYEGIDIGEGAQGLITYMRTDSVNLASVAVEEIREVIAARYGKDTLPSEAHVYKTKAKNAQEAHEAIRPTSAALHPDDIKHALSPDQYKLYNLVWKRTIACQMIPATIDTVAVDFTCGEHHIFRANGSIIAIPGFLQVYEEGIDDAKKEDGKMLPLLKEGDILPILNIRGEQHFTEPPPRYSEATLVKTMEEYGIGRPSTYATIISTLQQREYAVLENKRFHPTDVGRVVNRFLTTYFQQYVDYGFTAQLENELDEISLGEKEWRPVLREFWQPFIDLVKETQENVQRKDVTQEPIDEKCPQCGSALSIRLGRRGRFIGCTSYPECDYTRSLEDGTSQDAKPEIVEGRLCPTCESPLQIKKGKYGKFIGCSSYPDCKFIEPLEKPEDTGVECPSCKEGNILKRKSRQGKIFYSCARYPDCKYALWYQPLNEPCPLCEWPITAVKITKKNGTERVCPQQSCKFSEPYDETPPT
ncbi:type I DNA topoisomerase [Candidatus Berkiella aquae]|uniref:DNA topoisomerase 1 n=2 Tax=Candidatus Berkiella aquae TaxID=295108 RepID=A0A0Q9YYH4_9GAMM|nr:type I DNA topoisomerase [Candidatus Berkiella aquae]MCS5709816.1 type I DNA topoisomerase [Candidatus Berkiella aquae]